MGSLGERVVQALRERVVIGVSSSPLAEWETDVFPHAILVTVPKRMLQNDVQRSDVICNLIRVGVGMLPEHRLYGIACLLDETYIDESRTSAIEHDYRRALNDDAARKLFIDYCCTELLQVATGTEDLRARVNAMGSVYLPIFAVKEDDIVPETNSIQ